jgi:pSer/pThr/pTyr-binding forkhead associated (FHA) protein
MKTKRFTVLILVVFLVSTAVAGVLAAAGSPLEGMTGQEPVIMDKRLSVISEETGMLASYTAVAEDCGETSFPLVRDSYTLGRHRNNDIVIGDPKASSFHARIDRSPDGFVLVDLKSRNGCWLNGKRVETARLKTGDEVRVGMARLLYRVDYQSTAS